MQARQSATGLVVGREAELRAVDAFLDSIDDGFSVLALEGEQGIGKTTIWRESIHRARGRGYSVLACRPGQAEAKLSFAALADLLEPVAPEKLRLLPEPQCHALEVASLRISDQRSPPKPRAVAAGFRGIVSHLAEQCPVLVAIDDVQWLDSASAAALAFALRRLSDERVGVLAAHRLDARLGRRRPLELPSAQRVQLSHLSLAAIHEVLKRRLGRSLPRPLLVRLYEASRGNPLFALEIAREIVESSLGPTDPLPVPNDLRRLVRRRLARFSPETREALLVAAALGEPTQELLAAALGRDPSPALEEAEDAEVLEPGEQIQFAHPLYSAVIYGAASRDRRRELHRRLAEVVGDIEERARHLALAVQEPAEQVAAVLEEAALQASNRGATAAAAALWADASRLTPADKAETGQLRLLEAAQARFDSADTAAARALVERLVREMAPGPSRARAWLLMALVHMYEDGPVPAEEACFNAIAEAGEDLVLEAEANLRLSLVCIDDFEIARRATQRAVEVIRAVPDAPDDLAACALLDDAYIRFLTGGGIDRAQVAEAERLMPTDGETWLAVRAQSVLYEWSKYIDDIVRARHLLDKTAASRRAAGDEYGAALAEHHLSEVDCWLGDWARAREYALSSGRVIEQAGNPLWRASALTDLARVDAHLGAAAEAREGALEALAIAEEAEDPWFSASILFVLGFLELSVDDLVAAERWLSLADSTVERVGLAEPARFRFHGDHIEAVVGLGDLDRARSLLARLQRRAAVAPRPWILVMSARCEGLVHAASGRLGDAVAALQRALREHEDLEMPFELARTLLSLGRVQRRMKQRKVARETLGRALDTFERLGAPLWAEKARSELQRTHVREAPLELTPSEEQVARLAASGLKNREIAKRLFISPKTVEANLARAYRKLAVGSRAELGAVMAAQPPPRTG